jgi:hypothetical protein
VRSAECEFTPGSDQTKCGGWIIDGQSGGVVEWWSGDAV